LPPQRVSHELQKRRRASAREGCREARSHETSLTRLRSINQSRFMYILGLVAIRGTVPSVGAVRSLVATVSCMALRAHSVKPQKPETVDGEAVRWDYADAFELTPREQRSAEEWARATLEQGPLGLRLFVGFGWRVLLRLRLGPNNSADHVAGWPIVLRTPQTVVLGVQSGALGRARLTFRTGPSIVSASSNVSFERRGGRAMWSVAGLLHRRILPYLLGHAASSPPSA
jgi:hypothetical protein